jgi:hypothetical protein
VLQCQLQVVHHRQPLRGDAGSFLLPLPARFPGDPLAEVVEVGERPPPPLIKIGHLGSQILDLGVQLGDVLGRRWCGGLGRGGTGRGVVPSGRLAGTVRGIVLVRHRHLTRS